MYWHRQTNLSDLSLHVSWSDVSYVFQNNFWKWIIHIFWPNFFFLKEKVQNSLFYISACLLFTKSGTCVKLKAPQQSVLTISTCAHVQYWMYRVLCSLFPLLVLCSMLVSRFWTKKLPSYLNLSYKQSNKSMSNLFHKSTSDRLKL